MSAFTSASVRCDSCGVIASFDTPPGRIASRSFARFRAGLVGWRVAGGTRQSGASNAAKDRDTCPTCVFLESR